MPKLLLTVAAALAVTGCGIGSNAGSSKPESVEAQVIRAARWACWDYGLEKAKPVIEPALEDSERSNNDRLAWVRFVGAGYLGPASNGVRYPQVRVAHVRNVHGSWIPDGENRCQ